MNFKRNIGLIIFVFFGHFLFAQNQQTYHFRGFFNGTNLNIQCRSSLTTPWRICECIDSVYVNTKRIDEIVYGGYQVDLANKLNLQIYDTVHISLFVKGCELRIINPTDFYPKEFQPVNYLNYHGDGLISWAVKENYPDLKLWVQIEQFKWGEWIRIGPIHTITADKIYQADISDYLFNGANQIRAVVASISHVYIPAEPITIEHKCKKVKYKYDKKEKRIYFNKKTHFELWNEEWLIAERGEDSVINLKNQQPGDYHLRYGNREKMLKIK